MNEFSIQSLTYANVLILSNGKKNAQSIGSFINKSGDTILNILSDKNVSVDGLLNIAKRLFGGKKVYLVLDDTNISKKYSNVIAGTSDNFDASSNTCERSLCSVVIMVTDGKYAIPLDHLIWISKDFIGEQNYKKKTDLAKELIEAIISKIDIRCVVMDGLFAVDELISWLNEKKINFEMRFHANRVIVPDGSSDSLQIKRYFIDKLEHKIKHRTICAQWKNKYFYFTAVKRVTKTGRETIVYQISNFKTAPSLHARIYGFRWNIEKFFRTSKQHLGLGECQSRKFVSQSNHIKHVFLAYAVLQLVRKERGLKNCEKALHHLKKRNLIPDKYWKPSSIQNSEVAHA
jgi:hypothetical protein